MALSKLSIASGTQIAGAPRIRLATGAGLGLSARSAGGDAGAGRALVQFGSQLGDFAFAQGSQAAEREGAQAAASVTLEKKAIEHQITVEGQTRVVRDEAGVVLPNMPDQNSLSIFDQAYQKAVFARVGTDIQAGMRSTLANFYTENRMDPRRLGVLSDAYLESVVENAPPGAQAAVRSAGQRLASSYVEQAISTRAEFDFKSATGALDNEIEQASEDVHAMMMAGTTLYSGQAIQGESRVVTNSDIHQSFATIYQSLHQKVGMGAMTEAQVIQQVDLIGKTFGLSQMFAQIKKLGSSRRSALEGQKLANDFISGNVELAMPTVGEDGISFVTRKSSQMFSAEELQAIGNKMQSYSGDFQQSRLSAEAASKRYQQEIYFRWAEGAVKAIDAGQEPEPPPNISDPEVSLRLAKTVSLTRESWKKRNIQNGLDDITRINMSKTVETVNDFEKVTNTELSFHAKALRALILNPDTPLQVAGTAARKLDTDLRAMVSGLKDVNKIQVKADKALSVASFGPSSTAPSKEMMDYSSDRFEQIANARGKTLDKELLASPEGPALLKGAIDNDPYIGTVGLPIQVSASIEGLMVDARAGDSEAQATLLGYARVLDSNAHTRNISSSAKFMREDTKKALDMVLKNAARAESGDTSLFEDVYMMANPSEAVKRDRLGGFSPEVQEAIKEGVMDTISSKSWWDTITFKGDVEVRSDAADGISRILLRRGLPLNADDEQREQGIKRAQAEWMEQNKATPSRLIFDSGDPSNRRRLSKNTPPGWYAGIDDEFIAKIINAGLDKNTDLQGNIILNDGVTTKTLAGPFVVGENVFLDFKGQNDQGDPVWNVVYRDSGGFPVNLPNPSDSFSNWGENFAVEVAKEQAGELGQSGQDSRTAGQFASDDSMRRLAGLVGQLSSSRDPDSADKIMNILGSAPEFQELKEVLQERARFGGPFGGDIEMDPPPSPLGISGLLKGLQRFSRSGVAERKEERLSLEATGG